MLYFIKSHGDILYHLLNRRYYKDEIVAMIDEVESDFSEKIEIAIVVQDKVGNRRDSKFKEVKHLKHGDFTYWYNGFWYPL